MRIIVIGLFKQEIYAPAISSGFRSLGHEVLDIKYDDYHFNEKGQLRSLLNRIQDRYLIGAFINKFNNDIVRAVKKFKPDFIFLYRTYYIYDRTLKKVSGLTKIMSYNNDDPFSGVPSHSFHRHHISNTRFCDINFVYREKNIYDYKSIGVKNTYLLLPYYLTYNNYPIPSVEKDIPIAFIGHFENDGRDIIIKLMLDAGLPVRVYGNHQWKQSHYYSDIKHVIYEGVHGKAYNELLNRVQISLVFLSKINKDKYTRRCFEIPATKSMMLSQYTAELNDLFPEGECAEYFRDADELIEKCKLLLSNPSHVSNIANNGYLRLQELGGSEKDRCQYIIDLYHQISK